MMAGPILVDGVPMHSIRQINALPEEPKTEVYSRLIPDDLLAQFGIPTPRGAVAASLAAGGRLQPETIITDHPMWLADATGGHGKAQAQHRQDVGQVDPILRRLVDINLAV